ncbi:hypothetical protein PUN28_006476 [Cardiocondyla obscurior]|uniref:Uncharacterized protein n=1 Tax=Cardiocondyla obscurior TaxID=286306 RepID=A0AAW2GBC7_9HYME
MVGRVIIITYLQEIKLPIDNFVECMMYPRCIALMQGGTFSSIDTFYQTTTTTTTTTTTKKTKTTTGTLKSTGEPAFLKIAVFQAR